MAFFLPSLLLPIIRLPGKELEDILQARVMCQYGQNVFLAVKIHQLVGTTLRFHEIVLRTCNFTEWRRSGERLTLWLGIKAMHLDRKSVV